MQNESRKHNALVKCVFLMVLSTPFLKFLTIIILLQKLSKIKTTKRLFFLPQIVHIIQFTVRITDKMNNFTSEKRTKRIFERILSPKIDLCVSTQSQSGYPKYG